MPLYVGRNFVAKQIGKRTEKVICEKCKTTYYYELARVGVGEGTAPYYVGQRLALKSAEASAKRDLAKRLDKEADLVPCPKCHWVNQDLVNRFRRRQYRRAPTLFISLFIAGVLLLLSRWSEPSQGLGNHSSIGIIVTEVVVAICLSSPVWVLLGRYLLRRRIDPNATFPQWPNLPPGTPPALVESQDSETGEMVLVPSATPDDGQSEFGQWAVFRPGQIRLPQVCCMCLSPASTVYRIPLRFSGESEYPVPLCRACKTKVRRLWWLTILIVGLASLALGGALALIIPGSDAFAKGVLVIVTTLFVTPIGGVIIAGYVCRPYRMSVIDPDRGIVKFAASNPEYTALLVKQIQASNGIPAR